jgi:hypothetical protein
MMKKTRYTGLIDHPDDDKGYGIAAERVGWGV